MGKDILGRSVKILGMRSVRKDSLVPLPPMSGRQMIHVKYVPHVDTGLDLQIQHVTGLVYKNIIIKFQCKK
jgi:hypothetical protein